MQYGYSNKAVKIIISLRTAAALRVISHIERNNGNQRRPREPRRAPRANAQRWHCVGRGAHWRLGTWGGRSVVHRAHTPHADTDTRHIRVVGKCQISRIQLSVWAKAGSVDPTQAGKSSRLEQRQLCHSCCSQLAHCWSKDHEMASLLWGRRPASTRASTWGGGREATARRPYAACPGAGVHTGLGGAGR